MLSRLILSAGLGLPSGCASPTTDTGPAGEKERQVGDAHQKFIAMAEVGYRCPIPLDGAHR
jgi:hypothetical protein